MTVVARGRWLAGPGLLGPLGAVMLLLAALLSGCTAVLETETGVVISVASTSPVSVSGFTLRTADGRQIAFATEGGAFDQSGFPPEHLREHLALASPIKVTYRVTDGRNSVVRLEDAPTR